LKKTLPDSRNTEKQLQRYSLTGGFRDEALLPSGFPRRHWRKLFVEVGRLGFGRLSQRWQSGQQLIQSQGITYNAGSLSDVNERPWPMDPIPLIIDEREWAHIEKAVIQRATLLNALLADLYGPQRLLHERLLPATLIFGNPHFLRPCFGVMPRGGVHLHTYAVDLARSPDNQWRVIADRTQAPSGMGYTLQNRLVSARTFPGAFNQYQVRQLARFFDGKRDYLMSLGSNSETPAIVVLTPGPHNETYSEQSFLAGHWGFPLVEGADLTVIDNHVYLKTLGGLQPVHVILRRLDETFCDPLEFRGDSLLGVPGLMQAVRCGTVVIDNALGSGMAETAAQMDFLPNLCRELLGENLHIPSVATWWCGRADAAEYVFERLRELVIKPAFNRFGQRAEFPEAMDTAALKALTQRMRSRPEEFVAQERVALSTVPVRTDAGFAPRHAVLRVYAAWNGSSYVAMPGGLTRVSSQDDSLVVSMQLGGVSKDTWVLGGVEEPHAGRRQSPIRIAAEHGPGALPSRVADNLFWLGRYAERVEARVRLVRSLLPALSGEEDFGSIVTIETATRILAGLRYLPRESSRASIGEQRWFLQRILTEMVYDPSLTSSLRWNLKEMHRVARHLKERLSVDTWRALQQLESHFSGFAPSEIEQRYFAEMDLLDSAVATLSAFSGLLMENTTRGFGWRFLEIGRRMERALQTTDLLSSSLSAADTETEACLQVLLQIADSSITYRSRYPTAVQTDLVLELLLANEENPRSVGFQVGALLRQIQRLQEHEPPGAQSRELRLAEEVVGLIRERPPMELAWRVSGRFMALEAVSEKIRTALWNLSDALTARYLGHISAKRLTGW
jgi:uncharacterized circularly permuted ATP-grasp superfamily protein/uncharacterized alpha-E superfamily protein